ncbi:MAG TPA: MerR family transcriptional regulator, partial [Acidimicrobiales bacterium]|nr:MerR family transcriptional regulator [Acidimicrobiales bacterium]
MVAYDEVPGLRIGEVAHRTEMTVAALRAWERRYRILTPARTAGGQRLYSEADVERVRAVQRLVAEGWSIAGAVARLHAGTVPDDGREDPGRVALLGPMADVDSEAVLVAYQTA